MKRSFSLHGGAEFQQVWDDGKAWSHPLLILRARPNGSQVIRFGFVVGKKVGKAVQRNRSKRQMREAVRRHVDNMARGWDLIFIARRGIEQAEFSAIAQAVDTLLSRAHLLQDSAR